MSAENKKFYVTTPIYYVNARPHIGHAYTTIVADVLARRHRLLGEDTFFLTGTDEHGQKIERSAAAAGVPPQQFADEVSKSFEDLWRRMGITHDAFIRTTDPKHARGVQKLFSTLYERGFIELRNYTGAYCVSDETFVDAPAGTPCPDCGRLLETVTEENFFFKLSEFQLPLLDLIESNQLRITPESRRNEVLSFLRGGLKDLSISRSSFAWGVPVPEEAQRKSGAKQKHVIYVWLDALANYITALGYGAVNEDGSAGDETLFKKFWPADLHLVGKEIIRFHCVYWPAFLLALNPLLQKNRSSSGLQPAVSGVLEEGALAPASSPAQVPPEAHAAWAEKMLPKAITAHGWLLFDNSKMSKSKGNIVRTETILDAFGDEVYGKQFPDSAKAERDLFASDVLRYFLLREIPFGQDGTFSFDNLITRYNADLANGYGNLVSRTLKLVQDSFRGHLPEVPNSHLSGDYAIRDTRQIDRTSATAEIQIETRSVVDLSITTVDMIYDTLTETDFSKALGWGSGNLIRTTDAYISLNAPWKLAKSTDPEDHKKLSEVLYTAAESIRIITALLYPILPFATAKVWAMLGLDPAQLTTNNQQLTTLTWGGLKPGTKLGPLGPIFPRADKGLAQIMSDMENPTDSKPENSELKTEQNPAPPTTHPETTTPTTENQQPTTPPITIDDFIKVELRVAEIKVAERIPKADKLLRLEVDLGPAFPQRQILSGIAEWYAPEGLIGRRIIVITNLAPRKMRGLESHGMLLAASEEGGKPFLATVPEGVPLGTRLK